MQFDHKDFDRDWKRAERNFGIATVAAFLFWVAVIVAGLIWLVPWLLAFAEANGVKLP
jgi:hypothetical protein